jgi:hypothetical protein
MLIGFIYEWVDHETGLKYIGRHEGHSNDGYIGSGVSFSKEYSKRPDTFSRNILWEGQFETPEELKDIEEKFLSLIPDDELFYGINKKYYNICKNSIGFTSKDNPMKIPEIVEQMKKTQKIKNIKSPWENSVAKYGYENACKKNAQLGNTHGKGNKGKPKSEEHKRNISLNRKGGKPKGWRKD